MEEEEEVLTLGRTLGVGYFGIFFVSITVPNMMPYPEWLLSKYCLSEQFNSPKQGSGKLLDLNRSKFIDTHRPNTDTGLLLLLKCLISSYSLFSFNFFWTCQWHEEVLGPEIESVPQL